MGWGDREEETTEDHNTRIGAVFMFPIVAVMIIVSFLTWKRRSHFPLSNRHPRSVLVLNVFQTLVVLNNAITGFIGVKRFPCVVTYCVGFTLLSSLVACTIVRAWILNFHYNLTAEVMGPAPVLPFSVSSSSDPQSRRRHGRQKSSQQQQQQSVQHPQQLPFTSSNVPASAAPSVVAVYVEPSKSSNTVGTSPLQSSHAGSSTTGRGLSTAGPGQQQRPRRRLSIALSSTAAKAAAGGWYSRHRYLLESKYLWRVGIPMPLLLLTIQLAAVPVLRPFHPCPSELGWEAALATSASLLLLALQGVVLGIFMWKLRRFQIDGFGLKAEFLVTSVGYILGASSVLAFTVLEPGTVRYLRLWGVVGFDLISFITSNVYPLLWSYRYQRQIRAKAQLIETTQQLKPLLDMPEGFEAFLKFSSREFSSENCLFYKAVGQFLVGPTSASGNTTAGGGGGAADGGNEEKGATGATPGGATNPAANPLSSAPALLGQLIQQLEMHIQQHQKRQQQQLRPQSGQLRSRTQKILPSSVSFAFFGSSAAASSGEPATPPNVASNYNNNNSSEKFSTRGGVISPPPFGRSYSVAPRRRPQAQAATAAAAANGATAAPALSFSPLYTPFTGGAASTAAGTFSSPMRAAAAGAGQTEKVAEPDFGSPRTQQQQQQGTAAAQHERKHQLMAPAGVVSSAQLVLKAAKVLYQRYVVPNAPYQVNLPYKVTARLNGALQRLTRLLKSPSPGSAQPSAAISASASVTPAPSPAPAATSSQQQPPQKPKITDPEPALTLPGAVTHSIAGAVAATRGKDEQQQQVPQTHQQQQQPAPADAAVDSARLIPSGGSIASGAVDQSGRTRTSPPPANGLLTANTAVSSTTSAPPSPTSAATTANANNNISAPDLQQRHHSQPQQQQQQKGNLTQRRRALTSTTTSSPAVFNAASFLTPPLNARAGSSSADRRHHHHHVHVPAQDLLDALVELREALKEAQEESLHLMQVNAFVRFRRSSAFRVLLRSVKLRGGAVSGSVSEDGASERREAPLPPPPALALEPLPEAVSPLSSPAGPVGTAAVGAQLGADPLASPDGAAGPPGNAQSPSAAGTNVVITVTPASAGITTDEAATAIMVAEQQPAAVVEMAGAAPTVALGSPKG